MNFRISYLFTCVCIVLCGLITQEANATHAAGANLTYTCLGGNSYQVELALFRDCSGIAAPAQVTVDYTSSCGNGSAILTPIAGTGNEITVPCPSSPSTCQGGTSPGMQEWVYRATIALPTACNDYVFSWSLCCRNDAITNINNPGSQEMYLESSLNNVAAPCNSSPIFTNNPVAFVCLNQSFTYNHGVVDLDGDSLAYFLVDPLDAPGIPVTYIPPYSSSSPLASTPAVGFDPITGDITMTPTALEVTVVSVLVVEYRNGQVIGSVIRDLQIWVINCSGNNLPTASGMNGSNTFSVDVCPDQQLCFDVISNDVDQGQIVTMTWNSGVPGGTFTISGSPYPTGTFCWTPTFNDVSLIPHAFTVTVQDDACPINGIQTYSYNITVPSPFYTVQTLDVGCNGGNDGAAQASPVFGNPVYTYVWSNGVTGNTITGLTAGTYGVTASDTSGCSNSTFVTITEPPVINIQGIVVDAGCLGVCDGSIGTTVTGGVSPYTYLWNGGSTTASLNSLCAGNYGLTVTDANGCTATYQATIAGGSSLNITPVVTDVLCPGACTGSILLTGSGGTPPYTFTWSTGHSTQGIGNLCSGTYTVTISDELGCLTVVTATVAEPAAIAATFSIDDVSCMGGNDGFIDMTVSGGTGPYTFSWSTGDTTEDIGNLVAGTYSVTIADANQCTADFSATVSEPTQNINQDIIAFDDTSSCLGDTIMIVASGGFATYSWSNGMSTQSIMVSMTGTYSVTATTAEGCTAVDSATFTSEICCFPDGFGNVFVTIDGSNNVIAASDVWDGKYYVTTDVVVQASATLDLTNVDLVFAEGTGITFEDGSSLRANNSVLRSCSDDETWSGLSFIDQAGGVVNECIFKNAEIGLDIASASDVRIANNEFSNNGVGVQISNVGENSDFMEGITGNTFLFSDSYPATEGTIGSAFGIKLMNASIDGLISQNDFINSALGSANQFHGVYINGSSAVISENTFSNMHRAVDINSVSGATSIENNSIEYTFRGSSSITGIRVSEVLTSPVGITGNELDYNIAAGGTQNGIYIYRCTNLIVSGNDIHGFNSGIHMNTAAFNDIQKNNITDAGTYGVFITNAWNFTVDGNTITDAGVAGIAVTNCVRALSVSGNEVSCASMNGTSGIAFTVNNTSPFIFNTISISSNCVSDAETAMLFSTNRDSVSLPIVQNNFLYNYSGYGVHNTGFEGSIGLCAGYPNNAGRNSFVSNYLAPFGAAMDVVSTNSTITVEGNSSDLVINFPNVLVNTSCNTTSNASCGKQIGNNEARLGTLSQRELFKQFIEKSYPLNLDGNNYQLTNGFESAIAQADDKFIFTIAILDILGDNETDNEMNQFAGYIAQSGILVGNEAAWFTYRVEGNNGHFIDALATLNTMAAGNINEAELLRIEIIRTTLKVDRLPASSLSSTIIAELKAIDDRSGLHSAEARDLVQAAIGYHDYKFRAVDEFVGPAPSSFTATTVDADVLNIYPNPAETTLMLEYYTDNNVEDVRIRMYNTIGQVAREYAVESNSGKLAIDVSELTTGTYFISIIDGKQVLTNTKFIKY